MQGLKLTKKLLVVSNWAPPAPGGSPQVFFNLMNHISPDSYVIYTHEKNFRADSGQQTLPCTHYTYAPAERGSRSALFLSIRQVAALAQTIIKGLRIIKKENIALILGTPDKGTALFVTVALSLLSRRPYVLYMLDPYRGTASTKWREFFASVFEPILLHFAKAIILTGEEHVSMFRDRYGDRFQYHMLYHASPAQATQIAPAVLHGSPYTILYSGTIYNAQESSIRNLIRAIEAMHDMDIRLFLYVPKHRAQIEAKFAGHTNVSVHSASPHEMPEIQRSADILFLPLSWRLNDDVLRMAIPGKTPEYLVSGRPILVHAPPQSHISVYARKEHFAEIVDDENIDHLQASIRRLLTDSTYVQSLVKMAQLTFEKNHKSGKCAVSFKEILDQAA